MGDGEHEVKFVTLSTDENGVMTETEVRSVKRSDIFRCPFVIMAPEHYREDGQCECFDLEGRERMMREWEYTPQNFIDAGITI